jgi:hypothetical protein
MVPRARRGEVGRTAIGVLPWAQDRRVFLGYRQREQHGGLHRGPFGPVCTLCRQWTTRRNEHANGEHESPKQWARQVPEHKPEEIRRLRSGFKVSAC